MRFNWYKVTGDDSPKEIDTIGSTTYIYFHRNIQPKTDAYQTEYYQYDEAKLTPLEYQQYLLEQTRSEVDYLAMMSDIDLEEA